VFLSLGVPLFTAWKASSNPRAREGARYLFSVSGVEIVSSVGNSNLTWEAFGRVLETRKALLIFGQSGTPFIIPKRCFGLEEDAECTRKLLSANIKKSKLISK
jgi:YcxB-like protein